MKIWMNVVVAVLLVGCADEPNATKFRGIYLGQTLDEMNAAMAAEQTGMNVVQEGEPHEFQISKTKTKQICGHRHHSPELEFEWLTLNPCFFDLPEGMSLQDFKSHIVSITSVNMHQEEGQFVGISPFGERISVGAVLQPYVTIQLDPERHTQ